MFFQESFQQLSFEWYRQTLLAATCPYLVLKIEGKVAKFFIMTFTCRSPSYFFYGIYACNYTYLTIYGQKCYNRHIAINDNYSLVYLQKVQQTEKNLASFACVLR
jgi:hypothetical protein